MKTRHYTVASVLNGVSLCVLLFCILALLFPMQPSAVSAKPAQTVSKAQPLFSFSLEQVDTIRITQGQDSFCFVNHGHSFVIENMDHISLSSDRMDALLALLENFPSGQPTITEAEPFRRIDLSLTNSDTQTLLLYKEKEQILVGWNNNSYSFSPDEIEALLWSVEDFADPVILPELPSKEGSLRLIGSLHETPLELSFYTKEDSYICEMIAPQATAIDELLIEALLQSLSGLSAKEIVVLAPDLEDMDFFELAEPFCTIEGQISGESFRLSASPVQSDGTVYLLSNQQDMIYAVNADQIPWLSVRLETLLEDPLFSPNYEDTTTLIIASSKEQYRFTKWAGQVLCNGLPVDEQDFYDLFRLSTTLIPHEAALLLPNDPEILLTLTLSYTNPEQRKDQISFYRYSEDTTLLSINDSADFLLDSSFVDEIFLFCFEHFD